MIRYKNNLAGSVTQYEDDRVIVNFIPGGGSSPDVEYQAWRAAGNTHDPAETLDEAKARRSNEVDSACKSYISKYYDGDVKIALLNYQANGNDTQKAMCLQISAWTTGIMIEAIQRQGAIQAAETIEQVDAVSVDYSAFDATKPNISIADVITAGAS